MKPMSRKVGIPQQSVIAADQIPGEGMVEKRSDSLYGGGRTGTWIKIKTRGDAKKVEGMEPVEYTSNASEDPTRLI
jgi:ATP-dependent DNA ligase